MGKVGYILAHADFSRESEKLRKQAAAATSIHQQIWLLAMPIGNQCERLRSETRHFFTTLGGTEFKLHLAGDKACAGLQGRLVNKIIKGPTRHVVSVGRQHTAHGTGEVKEHVDQRTGDLSAETCGIEQIAPQ